MDNLDKIFIKRTISVIIPMYNAQKTIIPALKSITNQTYDANWEIIVINDGSTDESELLVRKYIQSNPRLNIIYLYQKNQGVSSARNAGLKIATGDLIAFLDSDDEWESNKIQTQVDYLDCHPNVSLIGTTINGLHFKSNFFKKVSMYTEITFKDQLLRNYFQPSTVLFRKNALNKVGIFPLNQRYAEEGNFFFKFTRFYKCVLINKSFVTFGGGKRGFGESGLSGNLGEMQKGEIRNLKFLRHNNWISRQLYICLRIFSHIKYLRRRTIVYGYRTKIWIKRIFLINI